jgi:hypothetical protein
MQPGLSSLLVTIVDKKHESLSNRICAELVHSCRLALARKSALCARMTYGRGTFCVGIQFRSQEKGETCMETSDGNEEELLLLYDAGVAACEL